jgi:hypothetical protein
MGSREASSLAADNGNAIFPLPDGENGGKTPIAGTTQCFPETEALRNVSADFGFIYYPFFLSLSTSLIKSSDR